MTWVLVLSCLLIVLLAVVTGISVHNATPQHCSHGCRRLFDLLGTSEIVYVVILGLFWLIGLGLLWLVTGWWGARRRRKTSLLGPPRDSIS